MASFLSAIRRQDPVHLAAWAGAAAPRNAPIGLFDSGVGGLTVALALAARLPHERFLYIADQAHVPYGGRPLFEVEGFAASLSGHLFQAGCKAVVMACNISSATALDSVRRVVGKGRVHGMIEAGARAARAASPTGRVGILATRGTVDTQAYPRALADLSQVVQVPCTRFVPLIEADLAESAEAHAAAAESLAPLLAAGVDTVVLGCTHYPLLRGALETAAAGRLGFVDPAAQLALELEAELRAADLLATHPGDGHVFATTGAPEIFEAQRRRIAPSLSGPAVGLIWAPLPVEPRA